MTEQYDFHADLLEAMAEPLCEELQRHVLDSENFGPGIYHPLVHQPIAFIPGHANRMLAQKKLALVEAEQKCKWNTFVFLHERPYRAEALEHIIDEQSA